MRRLAAASILVGLWTAGCGGAGPQPLRPVAEPAPRLGANQAGPSVQIGAGIAATGRWHAWAYRSNDGLFCLEYEGGTEGGSTCGDEESVMEPSVSRTDRGAYVMGGTQLQGAAGVVLRLSNGQVRPVPLVAVGPVSKVGASYFFVLLPIDTDVRSIDVLDAAGTVLESKPANP
jgi:hypothetical protein